MREQGPARLNTIIMNTTFVITYDLRKPGRDYSSLYSAIKKCGIWCHPVESTWFIHTDETAVAIRDRLHATMDANDKVIVAKASAPGAWQGLPADASDWLKQYLQ